MSRMIGTISRGVRAPIIRNGDNIVDIVCESVLEASYISFRWCSAWQLIS